MGGGCVCMHNALSNYLFPWLMPNNCYHVTMDTIVLQDVVSAEQSHLFRSGDNPISEHCRVDVWHAVLLLH